MHGHESEILTTTFLMLSAVSFGVVFLLFIISIELSVMAFLRVLQPAVIASLNQICCCILLALTAPNHLSRSLQNFDIGLLARW